ncbi:MAG TPA: hypothetical protein PLY49_00625 [Opitutaceae bacterium]|jgi:hypothetical protein|nr:hypothetical protein [Opitutaceae bacterium]
MNPKSPLAVLRSQIADAKAIAQDMLMNPQDADSVVPYARDIIDAWDRLQRLDELALKMTEELVALEQKLTIEGHFELDSDDSGSGAVSVTAVKAPVDQVFRILITKGMLNQNLFTLTKLVKRGVVRVGDNIELLLPCGDRLISKLLAPGNRLQERGRVRSFYEQEKARAGDFICMAKEASGGWLVRIEHVSQASLSMAL